MLSAEEDIIVEYDSSNDVLFLRFPSDKKQVDIAEPVEGVVVYLADDGSVLGFEIWRAKKRGFMDKLKKVIEG